ncbi:MAG: hypothetical protein HY763_00835 [Planctomycetes bacterium]|nr:hypothetical protein [Planctomycetota bacterium]
MAGELGIIVLLYAVGVLILVAEVFIPSHGILSVLGVGFLVAGIVKTFAFGGREAGLIAVTACMLFLPAFALVAVKYWHRTPFGKRISPPNPVVTAADTPVPVAELTRLVGATGRAVSPLRPVGVCEFGGRRVVCTAEFGMLDAGVAVLASGVSGGTLRVVERKT